MLPNTSLAETTRRAVLKAVGAALGVAAVGSGATAHNKFAGGREGFLGDNVADAASRTELVGYHSAGDVGPASTAGRPENAHQGAMTELRVHDDLAFVTMFTSRSETSQRGLAIFDISDYTRAETRAELESADLTLLSFVRNDNNLAAPIDCKVSDDGNYVFVCKQPLTALFGEAEDIEPNTDNHGLSPGAASLDAIDVSDPGNPRVTDSVNLSRWVLGPHNCWYHQINGQGYVFTTHGEDGVTGAMNVFEFDHGLGQLTQVNAWSWDGQEEATIAGEAGSFDQYAHDIVVQDDPRYGIPVGYISYIDAGTRVLDLSDPTDIDELGVFEMEISHHSVPAPTLIDGKRVMLCGQEQPDDDQGATGFIHLVDVDPIDEVIEGARDDPVYLGCSRWVQDKDGVEPGERPAYHMYDVDPDGDIDPLDEWVLIPPSESRFGDSEWAEAPGFEEEARMAEEDPEGKSDDSPGEYEGFGNFRLSTHNLDVDTDGRVYLGHYHGGARFFDIVAPGETVPTGPDGHEHDDAGQPSEEWQLLETGYYRRGVEIPAESAFVGAGEIADGLTASTPFHWCLVERNGSAFAGGINAGPQVIAHEDVPVGGDIPIDVTIDREADATLALGESVLRVRISADSDEEVVVRDRIPEGWEYLTGDDIDVTDVGDRTAVTLTPVDGVATYFVEAPDTTGAFTFGPVEYARSNGDGDPDVDSEFGGGNSTTNRLWRKENEATDTVLTMGSGIDL